MAFDISTGEALAEPRSDSSDVEPLRFEDFYEAQGAALMRLLLLACNDDGLANTACQVALIQAQRKWKHVARHPNPLAWALGAGLVESDKVLRGQSNGAINQATGGYVRGLALPDALAALPLHQRAALVTAYCAGWADEDTAVGFEVERSTIATRRTRGVTFLAHHLRADTIEAEAQLVAHFGAQLADVEPVVPPLDAVRKGVRRRMWRDGLLIAAVVLATIALGGAMLQAGRSESPVEATVDTALPPNSTGDWFGPVSDGAGGFVALNTRGASRFVSSSDGTEWFEEAVWNSRAADLRTEVTSFDRSGDRYVATIEAARSISGFVEPRVATSLDLADWTIRTIEIDPPEAVDGLRRRYRIVRALWADDRLLVALEIDESLDLRALSVSPSDVCVETATERSRVAHLCDGTIIEVLREGLPDRSQTRVFVARGSAEFVEIGITPDSNSLVSAGTRFAGVSDGVIYASDENLEWSAVGDSASEDARFLLVAGGMQGEALQVTPSASGWTSARYDEMSAADQGTVPLAIDPASIWTKPDLAGGPAGWALFVTSSRPWERGEVAPGWAVQTPKWIVSRLPDLDFVTVQRIDGAVTYTFHDRSEELRSLEDGTLRITDPLTGGLVAEISQAQIEASRSTTLRDDGVKSEVLFSADGQSWRSIWQSRDDAWFGSVAVGDTEVVLSGVHLAGRPISIPVGDE